MEPLIVHPPLRILRWIYSGAAQRWVRWRYLGRTTHSTFRGIRLVIAPGVFHPAFFYSSRILASVLQEFDFREKKLLDIGTGSGILGIVACKGGASVTAVDINQKAVECAQANYLLNGCQQPRVLQSDLFSSLGQEEQFDYIVWNPPFYPREPEGDASRAWLAGSGYSIIRRFAQEAPVHIAPGGSVLLILSTDMDLPKILGIFMETRLAARLYTARHSLFEDFLVLQFIPHP